MELVVKVKNPNCLRQSPNCIFTDSIDPVDGISTCITGYTFQETSCSPLGDTTNPDDCNGRIGSKEECETPGVSGDAVCKYIPAKCISNNKKCISKYQNYQESCNAKNTDKKECEDALDDSESENVCSYKTHNWIENQGDVKYCNQLTYLNEKLNVIMD